MRPRADPDFRWQRVETDVEPLAEPILTRPGNIRGYVVATTVVAGTTGIAAAIFSRGDLTDIVMIYLLGIVVISMRSGFRASVFSAVLSVLCFDFFFVPPYLTFAVANFRHVITFAVMLLVAVVIAGLTQRVRDEAERARRLADETARARVQLETEQLRSTLLSSVSHDLRTPLAVMTGTASTLLDEDATLTPATRKELVQTLLEESERLDRLVRNLLDMTRLESGAVRVKKEWQSVEEVVGAAFSRVETRLADRQITTRVPPDLLAPFDGVLIEQVLVNLLENVAKYSPPGSPIEVTVAKTHDEIIVSIADRGPGIAPGHELRIFEKFQRGPSERLATGVGLGLAICRAILAAHGGRIWAENRPTQGASFQFALPLEGEPLAGRLPETSEGSA